MKAKAITVIAVLVLFGCLLDGLPYDYFRLTRWVVCGACTYRAVLAYESKNEGWMWLFVGIAILFNPLAPIHLDRETWPIIDVICGLALVASLWETKPLKAESL